MGLLECISAYVPKRWTTDKTCVQAEKEEMELHLSLAVEQRSIMTVAFLNPGLAAVEFSGPCLDITSESLCIDARCKGVYSAYLDEAVQVCFTIEDTNARRYLRFTSTIRGYEQDKGFILDTPMELHSNQRREFVRITPPEQTILQMNVWPIESDDLCSLEPFVAEYEGTPPKTEDVSLVNLSVSGLRMRLKNPPPPPFDCFRVGSRLLCFLQLKGIENHKRAPYAAAKNAECVLHQDEKKTLELWLTGIVRYFEETEQSHLILGVNFTAWATVPGSEKNPTAWTKTDDKGQVSLLNDWVWRQQLQLVGRCH